MILNVKKMIPQRAIKICQVLRRYFKGETTIWRIHWASKGTRRFCPNGIEQEPHGGGVKKYYRRLFSRLYWQVYPPKKHD